jgi:hypothetical protein
VFHEALHKNDRVFVTEFGRAVELEVAAHCKYHDGNWTYQLPNSKMTLGCCTRRRWDPCRLGAPLQLLQISSHVGCVLVTQVAIFLQSFGDDVF